MKNYDYVVVIGRFQPFHNSHLHLVEEALKIANNKVIIVLGSAFAARNIRNPFSALEREEMIINSVPVSDMHRITFVHMRDYYYNENMWLSEIQSKVFNAANESKNIALLGHESDYSSSYLQQFPQWKLILVPSFSPVHATQIRNLFFSYQDVISFVPKAVWSFLNNFTHSDHCKLLVHEFEFIKKYKDLWSSSPFAPTFVTVDTVVVKSGHVLVVKRKSFPGKGLYALPGGFLNQDEDTKTGAIRELKEETSIAITKEELNKRIIYDKVFDYPERSLRGRTITHCYLVDLGSGTLPHIKGTDDAEHAFWLPLNEVNSQEDQFFEDHFHIITFMVSKI